MQNLATIKIFSYQSELHLAKSFLESEGIECFVENEFINQIYPVGTDALGCKLQVAEQDFERAAQLLIEGDFAKKEDFEPSESIKQAGKFIDWLKGMMNR